MKTRGPTVRWDLNIEKIFKNKCIYCGKVIPAGKIICDECRRKQGRATNI